MENDERTNITKQKSITRAHKSASVEKHPKSKNCEIKAECKTEPEPFTSKSHQVVRELFLYDNTTRELYDIILANLVVLTAVFLSALIPVVSVALPVLVFIFLEIGLWGFIYNKEMGKKYGYEDIFVSVKKYIRIFCMAVVKCFLILFWSILFVVPGVVCMLNYSFTGLILYESDDLDVKGALMLSKELTYGFRWQIFFYELLALASVCVAMSFMFFIIMFFDIFLVVPSTVYIVLVVMAALIDFVTLALPMMQIAIVDTFIISKDKKTA